MNRNIDVRNHIIEVTTELIEQYNGDIMSITLRMIAKKAGVGLGLMNCHFQSKNNLIAQCVQRIIGHVVADFHIDKHFSSDKERLIAWATYVFDFLFENSSISRISILRDFNDYALNCNSVYTQYGFMRSLENDIMDQDKPLLVFILCSAMQAALLGSETASQLLVLTLQNQHIGQLTLKN